MGERTISESVGVVLAWKLEALGLRRRADSIETECAEALAIVDKEKRPLSDEELSTISKAIDLASAPPATVRLKANGEPARTPGRKPKSEALVAAKPHVAEGRESPLTAERRAILVDFMGRSEEPCSVEGLSAVLATRLKVDGPNDVEGLLCEDPETFVQWTTKRNGDAEARPLWSLWEQFYSTFNDWKASLGLVGIKDCPADLSMVSEKLGCSAAHARRAIRGGVTS